MGQQISIKIEKNDVFDEVAKTTAYIGSKKVEQKEGAYDRIFVTTEDRQMLERYYEEGCNALTNLFRRYVTSVTTLDGYAVTLSMGSRFDITLKDSMLGSMTSYLVNYVLGKWCEVADKDGAKEYTDAAVASLQDVREKAFYKTKPTRKTIS